MICTPSHARKAASSPKSCVLLFHVPGNHPQRCCCPVHHFPLLRKRFCPSCDRPFNTIRCPIASPTHDMLPAIPPAQLLRLASWTMRATSKCQTLKYPTPNLHGLSRPAHPFPIVVILQIHPPVVKDKTVDTTSVCRVRAATRKGTNGRRL